MASSSGCARGAGERSSPGVVARDASVSPPDAGPADQRFPRSCRLTARRQFLDVYERGRRVGSRSLVLFGLPSAAGRWRLGLTVSRKVGKAVRRNRVKRVLREVFRRHRARLDAVPMDLVVNARPGIERQPTPVLERELLEAIERLARRVGP